MRCFLSGLVMRSATLSLLVLMLSLATVLVVAPLSSLLLFVSDDAYYYLNVARNNAAGLGLTFDGLNPTNGWHPLWMIVVQPVYYMVESRETALRVVLLLQLLTAFLALTTAARFVLRLPGSSTAMSITAIAGLLILVPVPVLLINGLETTMLLLVEFLLIIALTRADEALRWRLASGLLIGLMFLARLDSAFVILAIAAWLLITELKKYPIMIVINRWWLGALAAAALALMYFAWNISEFGAPMPISGALKNTFPEPHLRLGFIERVPQYVFGIITAVAWLIFRLINGGNRWHGVALAIGAGCLVHLAWSIVFMAWGTFQWHFISYIPVITLATIDFLLYLGRWQKALALVAVLAAVSTNAGVTILKWGHHTERLRAAEWASANLEHTARIGLRDAGIFGYFTAQQVVNLDGLINGYAFQEAIHTGKIESFLEQAEVSYTADAYVPCNYDVYAIRIITFSKTTPKHLIGEARQFSRENELFRAESSKLFERLDLGETCFIIWQGRGEVKLIQ